jgi:poly(3-hydroxybutyrate) depolymerase
MLWLLLALIGCGDDASTTFDAGTPTDAGARPDGGATSDAGTSDAGTIAEDASRVGIDPSGGTGGTYPGLQSRTAMSGGTSVPYDLYVPTMYDPSIPLPLVSLFHGQGDTGGNMVRFWRDAAEAGGFMLLATSSTGAMGGWTGGDVALYDIALTDALGAYNIEQARLYLWGFSAGAHLVYAIALMNTDTFAAFSVNAGALEAFAGPDAPSMAPRRIPADIHIGRADPLYPRAQADRDRFVAAGWTLGTDLSYVEFDGPHTVLPSHPGEIGTFLLRFTR